nr:immunoglobulin light chain junction region [Macaca mulatta]MOX76063.1 immunoglobulin light chain junction region [Macaca mulatta]MOX76975.1 immunoglobulin light chain junction region [Macaca mulatta]
DYYCCSYRSGISWVF